MKTMLRLISSVVVVLAALTITVGAVGATPTLGGSIDPARLTWEQSQTIRITSLCVEVDCKVTIDTDGPGWSFDATTFVLKPGETKDVAVTAAGKDDTTYIVRLAPVTGPMLSMGGDANALTLTGKLMHRGFYFDAVPVYLSLLALMILGMIVLAARWVRRHLRVV
jgi:hypothetical protein